MGGDTILEVRGVQARGGLPLDFTVERGEAVAMCSPGGTGKRWMLRVAAGLRDARPGSVRSAATKVAYVFSSGGLIANLSAIDNIVLPLRFAGVPAATAEASANEVLAGLGLAKVARQRPATLADEAKQLVQWARAMAIGAEFLFLEEPFRQLSPDTTDELAAWLRGELSSGRVSVLMTCTKPEEGACIGARPVPMPRGA